MQDMDQLVQGIVAQLKQKEQVQQPPQKSQSQPKDGIQYPLREHCAQQLKAKSGKPYEQVTYEALIRGEVEKDDLKTHADTLWLQAEIAYRDGKKQFGDNLMRAAEMTAIPDEEVLEIYNLLRPNRTDKKTLLQAAEKVRRDYGANAIAALIESAAQVYEKRGIAKP